MLIIINLFIIFLQTLNQEIQVLRLKIAGYERNKSTIVNKTQWLNLKKTTEGKSSSSDVK